MASLPVEILYGLYLGVLTGLVPALIAWLLGFGFKYFTGITIPGLGVVGLGVMIAGLNGGLLALADPSLTGSANQLRLTVALLVVLMGTLYAHGQGDKMGASLPRRMSLRELTKRTLSADVVELVGGRGQVKITVVGDVGDLEGYPPLPAALREAIRAETWTFPADLPLVELESRVAAALRTEYDLVEVSVTLDERARATVSAAPPTSGLSKHLKPGERAVSVDGLVPTGAARGDEVAALADGERFDARLLGVVEDGEAASAATAVDAGTPPIAEPDGGESAESRANAAETTASTATGGPARVTLALARQPATTLLGADDVRLIVTSRGSRREFELVGLLRRTGKRFRRFTVGAKSELAGATLGETGLRDVHGVVVLAIRHDGSWSVAPRGTRSVAAGDDLLVVGGKSALDAFGEVVS
ncbi:potassium channel family protein [Halobellus litoreus]|uniref:potassium channel family protein n=1 Tax=Halobellus litoreus TaxID=755310 RepID=UPI00210DE93A|nr:TrkA C-terminal domain-containing protein [Halobellus litoreus]